MPNCCSTNLEILNRGSPRFVCSTKNVKEFKDAETAVSDPSLIPDSVIILGPLRRTLHSQGGICNICP